MDLFDLFRETIAGKSLGRILFNWEIKKQCRNLTGTMLDLACGSSPSYRRYWTIRPGLFVSVEYHFRLRPSVVADAGRPLPFRARCADHVFLFNALHIFEEPEETIREVYRTLNNGGWFYLSTPFVFNESREPHDYCRFTSEKIENMLKKAGFKDVRIIPLGERFSSAAYLIQATIPKIFRIIIYPAVLLLDKLYSGRNRNHPCPGGYFCTATKG